MWDEFRRRMPVARTWAYFDHAAVAPLSGPAGETLARWTREQMENGAADWGSWAKQVEETRRLAAQFIGASADEIALVSNTTTGINLVAEGFPWRSGDNVVTLADEFPSNLYPWMNLADRGVETRWVSVDDGRVDLDRIEQACDARTRMIAASWVGYASGWRNDIDALVEIAHRRGAYLFLDAIQGLGVFPLDVVRTRVDFLAADGHKWLLGPEGAGIFYLRREHLGLLRPLGVGWNSVVHSHDFSHIELRLKNTAARYEGGTCNMGGLAALGASLDLLIGYGIDAISARLLEVSDELCRRLQELGAVVASCRQPNRKSGIVSFELAGHDPQRVRAKCREQNVLISCRGGKLRASPHVYTNGDDIDRLERVLRET